MAKRRRPAEQAISSLRAAEVPLAQGTKLAQVYRGLGVTQQPKRLEVLEKENARHESGQLVV